jgi:glycosyltransferase involved in cell wall biosynthesis
VRGAGASWRLVIAGDGAPDYRARLEALAAASGAGGRVEFAGWVGGEDKTALLSRAALFALPSHQENFGIAVLEGLARGVPAIVSPQVNLAAAIDRAGAGWIARDDHHLGAVLDTAMRDDRERASRAAQARALAETFRWSAIAPRIADLYTRVSGAARGGVAPVSAPASAAS